MTTSEFVAANKITATVRTADSNPNMLNDGIRMHHFRVTLHMGRKRLTVPFSQGLGISGEPTAADVLDCLASDAASAENAAGFEDWAADFGYDTDSRKAERTYNARNTIATKLQSLLGAELYDALLWHTDRD
jgi:hypothetical protein